MTNGPNTNFEDSSAADLQSRVRLYVMFLLFIDVFAYISDFASPLLLGAETAPLEDVSALRWAGTAINLTIAILLFRLRLPAMGSAAIEFFVNIGISFNYVTIALKSVPIDVIAPVFALLGLNLVLIVRAALIPSPVLRTAAVGMFAMGFLAFATRERSQHFDPLVTDGLSFMAVSVVLATMLISRVIYGLREQVSDMRKLGQYTLERKIGEGGMGVVYEASHGMLRRPTAIKLLRPEKAGAENIERFEREVQLTAQLSHPNTITVFDYGRTPEGVFYYAMELIHGPTLEHVVQLTGAQPQERVRSILMRCAAALREAHDVSLIHRDIKPSNIMLCRMSFRNDVVKLLDFGLVKSMNKAESPQVTATETIVGTPAYMAPESIVAADSAEARSDLYSLAAVGYFLLTGTHVFEADTVVEVCGKHLHEAPEPPSARVPNVHPDLEALLLQCLEKHPDHRPHDAKALYDALEAIPLEPYASEEWWEEFAPALDALKSESTSPISGRTLAIAPRS